jgi:hypothetical protein
MSFQDTVNFWEDFDWDWRSSADVKKFVDEGLRTHVIESSWQEFGVQSGVIDSESWVILWWFNVQEAIQKISRDFSAEELSKSVVELMRPMEEVSTGGDQAIYDALIKYVPGFPSRYPEYSNSIEVYDDVWCEFSWLSMGDWRYFLWIFYGRDNIAKSPDVESSFLQSMFDKSFHYEHQHQALRVRIGLAMNPSTPAPILEFLLRNRHGVDWLLHDGNGDDLEILLFENNSYEINSELIELDDLRSNAEELLVFEYPATNSFEDCPGVEYMENLFGHQILFKDANEALNVALAMNPGLSSSNLEGLAREPSEYVRYFLSKNPSIPIESKVEFALTQSTITFQPYGSNIVDPITLS